MDEAAGDGGSLESFQSIVISLKDIFYEKVSWLRVIAFDLMGCLYVLACVSVYDIVWADVRGWLAARVCLCVAVLASMLLWCVAPLCLCSC